MCPKHIDDTLSSLTPGELGVLRQKIVNAITDQPAHMTPEHEWHRFVSFDLSLDCGECYQSRNALIHTPNWDKDLAYELSVLNWEIRRTMAGSTYPYDEIWKG